MLRCAGVPSFESTPVVSHAARGKRRMRNQRVRERHGLEDQRAAVQGGQKSRAAADGRGDIDLQKPRRAVVVPRLIMITYLMMIVITIPRIILLLALNILIRALIIIPRCPTQQRAQDDPVRVYSISLIIICIISISSSSSIVIINVYIRCVCMYTYIYIYIIQYIYIYICARRMTQSDLLQELNQCGFKGHPGEAYHYYYY